jgi:hypothetical protein
LQAQIVPLAELDAAEMWIANWSRMLPVVNATRGLLPRALINRILGRVPEPEPLRVSSARLSLSR